MSDFEGTTSEKKNGRMSNFTRTQLHNMQVTKSESYEREKQNKLSHYNNCGTGKYINLGSSDRMLGRISKKFFELKTKGDIRSYLYGYYIKGTRNLALYCEGIVPDYIDKRELLNIVGFDPETEITKETIQLAINKILVKVGYEDSQDEKIIYEELPLILQNNPYYNEGYNLTASQNNTKGKK